MPHTPSRAAVLAAVLVTLVVGGFVALQSRINGGLGLELGDGFTAAIVSFGSGFVILTVALVVWRPGRRGLSRVRADLAAGRLPWWMVLGGIGGGAFVLMQGLVAGVLGVALFTVAVVAGQTLTGLVIDRRGMGDAAPRPFTIPRLAGTVLALGAVAFAVSSRVESDIPVWVLLLPFAAGLAVGFQQAANGQVRQRAESALAATWINFLFGTAMLAIVATVHALAVGWPTDWPTEPWLYVGGVVGVVFIAAQTVIVRTTGVLLMGLALVAGQLVASIVLDVLLPAPGHELAASTVIGTIATLVAVLIAAVPARPLGRARRDGGVSAP